MTNAPIRIGVLVPAATDACNARILQAIDPVVPADVPVLELARQLEQEGFDGIWLTDFDMCGVEAAREIIDIPIVGGFPTFAFSALALSQRFSIITVLQSTWCA